MYFVSLLFFLPYTDDHNIYYHILQEVRAVLEDKILLSIKEASFIFGIGQHRLRDIVKDDYNCQYHLTLGRVIKIKRKPFEDFINSRQQI